MSLFEQIYETAFPNMSSCFELPSWLGEPDWKEVCRSMSSVCNQFAEDIPKSASGLGRRRSFWLLFWLLVIVEIIRYLWHRIRLVALNFRRHTPPSSSYTLSLTFSEHADIVEKIFCDRTDLAYCIEGLFCHRRPLNTITREMLHDALQAHLAMEVRRWYPKKHCVKADEIIQRIETTLGHTFEVSDATRENLPGGASIAQPVPYNAHPDDFRKPYLYIGEQKLNAYFKPLPTQCVIWTMKMLKLILLRRWGFQWHNLGPVQVWIRHPKKQDKGHSQPPLLFCPGLFLGNTAYLAWIYKGLLPLGETRSLFLLELPHLSHGLDPRKIAYSLHYSWPSSDEVSDAIARFLQSSPGPVDIVGNSFGTVVMTALRRPEYRHLFRKFVYIDPVCFMPCFPKPMLTVAEPSLDSYKTLYYEAAECGTQHAAKRRCRIPKLGRLIKFLVLRPTIFGDLEVQYVMKRGLYIHECTERGKLGSESLVILGKTDELLHQPLAVAEWLGQHFPEASVELMNFNHGAMMGHPEPYAKSLWEFLKADKK